METSEVGVNIFAKKKKRLNINFKSSIIFFFFWHSFWKNITLFLRLDFRCRCATLKCKHCPITALIGISGGVAIIRENPDRQEITAQAHSFFIPTTLHFSDLFAKHEHNVEIRHEAFPPHSRGSQLYHWKCLPFSDVVSFVSTYPSFCAMCPPVPVSHFTRPQPPLIARREKTGSFWCFLRNN